MNPHEPNPISWKKLTDETDHLFRQLFPICRSLTGEGVGKTFSILKEITPFEVKNIPSGTRCYDWEVPEEWHIKDACIKDAAGEKIVDFQDSNLHVVNYSIPKNKKMTFQELKPHLHSLPQLPGAIPYRTSYYFRDWGFCLTHNQLQKMDRNGIYHVYIDSRLSKGSLQYGECHIKGKSREEILISTYCCHPSMGNDNLSGMVLWSFLLRELKSRTTRYSYRFLIAPETIGAICYLCQNEKEMKNVTGGFTITTVAGPGSIGYKNTFLENHLIDRVVKRVFEEQDIQYINYPFDINGSDETHFSAPFFRIPVGTICKDKYCEYDFYHTSLDNLDFINASYLVETLKIYLYVIEAMERNHTYRSLHPFSEPMLGKRGLFPNTGGHINQQASSLSKDRLEREYKTSSGRPIHAKELDMIRWMMFLSDGKTTLLDIAEKTKFPLKNLYEIAEILRSEDLLELVSNK